MKTHHHLIMSVMMLLTIVGILWLVWATTIDGRWVRRPIVIYDVVMESGQTVQLVTDKLQYNQGETVRGLIKYCKTREIEVEFQWSLIDTYLKFFPKKKAQAAIGCHEVLTDIEMIPLDQYPDTDLYFETVLTYKINGLNTVNIPIRTNTFRVK
jgi:hypothetical protein